MNAEDFVHLHVHTEYSLLDGSIKVKKLIKEAVARQYKAIAITDHDGMHGCVELYLEALKEKIRPIIGYEANVEALNTLGNGSPIGHLILLAQNTAGYKNLIKLSTIAATTGRNTFGEESIALKWDEIKPYSDGLICLTSCLKGEFAQLVEQGENEKAGNFLSHLQNFFGKENVYVELIDNNLSEQKVLIPKLVEVAQANAVPIVATADVHYLKKEDKETHLSLLAIKHKIQRNDLRSIDKTYEFHLATFEEMQEKFSAYPEALANTKVIADKCDVLIDTKKIYMPDFREKEDETAEDCLARLAWQGLEDRKEAINHIYKGELTEELWNQYKERLEYEINVINSMKFSGYFLIVRDFINWAKKNKIPVGPGRGSAAGSLVTYALLITNIDPIRFNLLFERFLNPERVSMPDIDTDFCQDRRDDVIQYVYDRYGRSNVAQIVTFGRLMAKNAIKSLARIQGWNFTDSNNFAKLIPESPGITLEQAYEQEDAIQLRLDADDRAKTLWKDATEIEGILNSLGIHAAGVIISDRSLSELCPMMESEGQMLTQLENKFAEKIGLIKFDFLGLKTLTVIDKATKFIHKRYDPSFDIEKIDIEDEKVYKNVSTAHVTGIFQLESGGMRKLIADLKPTVFSDIVAINALFRPGPLGSGMVEDFVLRKHGKNAVEYPIPELEPILQETYGVMVFQEQIQKIAALMASYSLGEADLLRRAMGKKDKAEMERQKQRFLEGATVNGFDKTKSEEIFDLMAKFADYGFNKSHSAAYGWVTYQTAYLKTYYPTEFMAAIMSCDLDNTDKIVNYVRDCRRMKLTLLPPSVNDSFFEFTIPATHTIQFGLGAVKGLGKGVIELIVEERNSRGKFKTVPEFIARIDPRKINKKVLESLIKSGAFDTIATNRAELLANVDGWQRAISKEFERQDRVGDGIFGGGSLFSAPTPIHTEEVQDDHAPQIMTKRVRFAPTLLPTQIKSQNSAYADFLAGTQVKKTQPWSRMIQLQNEQTALGFYMSGHPADIIEEDIEQIATINISEAPLHCEQDNIPDFKRKQLKLAGIITMNLEKRTKENEKFCVLRVEDCSGEIEIAIFPKQFAALTTTFNLGDAVWVDCKIRKGIEEGTVKGVCQAIGKLSDKRVELARRITLKTQADFISEAGNLKILEDLLKKHKGITPVFVEVPNEDERVTMRFALEKYSVSPSDEFIHDIENNWPGALEVRRQFGHFENRY